MTNDLRFSRIGATADGLSVALTEGPRAFEKPVLLTGTDAVLREPNGREMARSAMLLLMRTTADLTIALPDSRGALTADLQACAVQHAWEETPRFIGLPVDFTAYAAVLSIGGAPRPDLPWTVITSNGWLARVTSTATPVDQACQQRNPVGACAAASLGASEVFKRLVALRPDRGRLLDGCSFSLWDYRVGHGDPGPEIPDELEVDLLIGGGGAIGNGVAHLLSQLPIVGRATVVDSQRYGEENWGTCIRLTRKAAEASKAHVLASLIERPGFEVEAVEGGIESLAGSHAWRTPSVVLSGFDNVPARHAIQDLWPDIAIDGAIGPRLECQVSAHPWESQAACLRCIFEEPPGEPAKAVQQRVSGLTPTSLDDLTRPLTDADVAAADSAKRSFLRKHLGKPICSVLTAAQELAATALPADFRPSVPFVATMSASMMVTEMVRHCSGRGEIQIAPRYFFSLLWGPDHGEHFDEDRRPTCRCVTRKKNIEIVRGRRAS